MDIIDHQIDFIVKVLGLSSVIKYVAIVPTSFHTIMEMAIPPLLMICALVWKLRNQLSIDLYIDKDSIR
ncbi:MAG: hypothetical protein ACP8RL_06155 [cyanobacterium endosymbiont of Rhopalodia inflata]